MRKLIDKNYEEERMKVYAELKKFSCDFNRDFNICLIGWNYKENKLFFGSNTAIKMPVLYFKSRDIAEYAIKTVGLSRVKKYYLEVG